MSIQLSTRRAPSGSSITVIGEWRRGFEGTRAVLRVQRDLAPERVEQVGSLDEQGRVVFQSDLSFNDNTFSIVVRSRRGEALAASAHSLATGQIRVSPASPRVGEPVTFSATLGTALRRPVLLQRADRLGRKQWETIARTRSQRTGAFAITEAFDEPLLYRFRVPKFATGNGTIYYSFTSTHRRLVPQPG